MDESYGYVFQFTDSDSIILIIWDNLVPRDCCNFLLNFVRDYYILHVYVSISEIVVRST